MSETQRPVGPRSAALLAYLLRVPRFALVLAVIVLFLAGAFLPGVAGAVLVLVIAALVGWLAWLAWGSASPGTRAVRVVAVVVLLTFATAKIF
ncbi:DUF6703 family protein [Cryptosporangium sp. NPDC051539]|uniref:DUF6703 family protein n=1 Tax=Cryptosporangium sp. NPDC051539 TaxID=3363962 RepID=UPI0037AAF9A9